MKRNRNAARITEKSSLFNKYLISYISLALVGCLVVGTFFLFSSTHEIESVIRQETMERMKIAIGLMDTFENTLTDIAARIRLDKTYDRRYIQETVLHEPELIQQLAKYRNYSPLIDQYCLYYPRFDVVYTDSTKCSSFRMYCRYLLKIEEVEQLRQEWTDQYLNRWYESQLLPGKFIYAKPLVSGNDTLILVLLLYPGAVEDYLTQSTGMREDRKLMVRLASDSDTVDRTVSLTTTRNTFVLSIEDDGHYAAMRVYLTQGIVWVLLIMTVLLATAVFAAYQSYLPIRRLIYKYIPARQQSNSNELKAVEETLLTLLRDSSKSQRQVQTMISQLHEQQSVLRQYFACELLTGRSTAETVQSDLRLSGIDFTRKYYMLLHVISRKAIDIDKANATMEKLTDETMYLFCVKLPDEDGAAVLANLQDTDNTAYVMEIVESIFEESEIRCSEVYSDLSETNAVWLELNGMNMTEILEKTLGQTSDDIRRGDGKSALDRLHNLLSMHSNSSDLEQQGIHLAVIRCICGLADEAGVALGMEQTQALLITNDIRQFISRIMPVINELAASAARGIDDMDARKVIDIIEQNLGSYELSKEWVAEQCGMSEYMVGRVFRNFIKMSYTDYVRIRRLNKAKEMLAQTEMTVNEIGISLGYTNISYFIRAFREYVGTTPAMYRMEKT